jgi:uncharacterized protein with PQ loop repeat
MNAVDTVGTVACVITTIYTSLGLPVQVHKNYTQKSVSGLSLPMMVMSFCTFNSWVLYGAIKPIPDWYVIISNGPGVLFIGVVLVQFFLYRNNKAAGSQKTG